MSDLVDKFFSEDLTGADEEALEKSLWESPEAASRFTVLAEEAYVATGLPAHQWPGKAITIPSVVGMGTGLKLFLALLAAGTGMVIWRFWPQAARENSPQAVTRSSQLPTVLSQPVEALRRTVLTSSSHLPIQSVLSQPVEAPQKAVSEKILPLKETHEVEGDALGILVETPQLSLVTVRILDAFNQEIRVLYTGVLDPGKWSFRWDGLLDKGQTAPGGSYKIEVQNGPHRLSKQVSLLSK